MQQERALAYSDQFEYFGECFDLIRKRGDASNIRSEAMETERMVRYSERNGFVSDRSHLLEIYRGIETEANRMQAQILARKKETELAGIHFPFQDFIDGNGLGSEEVQILLVLLYNESVGRNHTRFTTGNEILNLVFVNPVDALKASRFLDGGGTLFAKGLVRSISDDDTANFLRAVGRFARGAGVPVLDPIVVADPQHLVQGLLRDFVGSP